MVTAASASPSLSGLPQATVPVRSPRTSIILAELARQRRFQRWRRRLFMRDAASAPSPPLSPAPVRSPRTSIILAELARERRFQRWRRRLLRFSR